MRSGTTTRDRILEAAEQLVYDRGFSSTTLDAILSRAEASKGAFFHHFKSKEMLGEVLLARYATADAELAREMMKRAEALTDDPAEQIISFVQQFAAMAGDITAQQPGCLFVSFIYERGPGGQNTDDVIVGTIELWRNIILDKLALVDPQRGDLGLIDPTSMADMVFTTFEGGFILARATNDRLHLGRQLKHLQHYFELVLDAKVPTAAD